MPLRRLFAFIADSRGPRAPAVARPASPPGDARLDASATGVSQRLRSAAGAWLGVASTTWGRRPRRARSPRALVLAAPLALALASVHAQDAAAGGMAFLQCAECHSPGTSDGAGPGLKGVVGRRAGAKDGFAYSPALAKATLVWDDAALDAFLANPQKALPGTTMAWPGDPDAKERADLIAYLKTLR